MSEGFTIWSRPNAGGRRYRIKSVMSGSPPVFPVIVISFELREDGGFELREDGSQELRE